MRYAISMLIWDGNMTPDKHKLLDNTALMPFYFCFAARVEPREGADYADFENHRIISVPAAPFLKKTHRTTTDIWIVNQLGCT